MASLQDLVEVVIAWNTIWADSTSQRSFPVTGWMTAAQFAKVQADFELRELGPNLQVSVGYETANVENAPDAPNGIGGFQSTNGVHFATSWTDTSANTDGKKLFRLCLLAKLSTGAGLTLGRAAGKVKGLKK
jgi:hypothetical protein